MTLKWLLFCGLVGWTTGGLLGMLIQEATIGTPPFKLTLDAFAGVAMAGVAMSLRSQDVPPGDREG